MKRVEQTSGCNCGQACLSIVTGAPISYFENLLGDGALYDWHLAWGLHECGMALYEEEDRKISKGFIYLLSVRSINHAGVDHLIVLDTRKSLLEIYDPSPKKRYDIVRLEKYSWLKSYRVITEAPPKTDYRTSMEMINEH